MSAATERVMAAALSKIADAVVLQAETNAKLALGMERLTNTIQGAHRLVVENTEMNVARSERRNADMKQLRDQLKNGPRSKTP